jgi:two-component system, cell cycle sensor histidine kinase and response regulator CckA
VHPANINSLDQTQPDLARLKPETSGDVVWHCPVGIFTSTPDGRFIFANPAMARIYGYSSPAELIASITDISSQIDADPAEREIFLRQVRERGELLHHEYQHLRRDGPVFWVSLDARAIYDQQGQLSHYQGFSTDITERKSATGFIESRERYLQKILDTIGEGFWVINAKGFLQEVNQTYCAMSGYCREELLGLAIGDLDASASPDETAARINRIKAGGTEFFETLHRRKDGSTYPVELSVTWLDQDGGQMVCFCRDITKRKVAEEALRESEEKYRLLFNTFPLGITVSDPSDNIVESNARAAELLNIAKDEHETRRIDGEQWQIIRSDGTFMPAEEWASVRALQENRLVENTEMGLVKPGEKITWINVTAAPLPLENYGVVITYNDITERKRIEQALRESEDWFRAIIEGAPDAVFVQTEKKFAYLNTRAMQLFGAKNKTELLGQPVFDRFHPDFHDQVQERIRSLNADRQPVSDGFEQKYLRLDGSEVWVETTGQPIVYQEKNGALVFVRDITARKQAEAEKERLEAQLQQAQKMESVGRLAGGVAHDFNNMLGVIFGHTEMALEDVDPASPLYASLQAVHQAAERSAALTRQLLAFARKQTVAPKVIDLNETVVGVLKMLRRLIGEDIDLLWQPGRNLQPVKVDPAQIDQLLANLCVNARDAITGVGEITIETASVRFDEGYCAAHHGYLPGEYTLLAVSDDGCGMDRATQNLIFEPFFTTKEQGKGTGLGLASVFGMVKQNNGFINVYSEPGQGTTFQVYLPAYAVKSAGVVEKAPDLPAEHGNETILLVEDESAILKMTTMMLTRLGYTVVAAATPGEAIRLAHGYPGRIDLLMTDVVMAEMNGRELAATLLCRNPDLKRLFMSGYTANIIAHHGVLNEGVHFIQKPFSMKDLGGKLREALEGGRGKCLHETLHR